MSVLILYIEKRFYRHASDYIRHICYSIFLFRWKDVQTIKHPQFFVYMSHVFNVYYNVYLYKRLPIYFETKMFWIKRDPEREKYELITWTPTPFGFQTIEKYVMKRRKIEEKIRKKEKNGYTTFTVHFFTSFMFTHLYILYQYTACWYPRRIPTDKKSV